LKSRGKKLEENPAISLEWPASPRFLALDG
jgi:hypothetical protein